MTKRPTRAKVGGRAYLDLRSLAKATKRPTDELLQLYALEGFLHRLQGSPHATHLVLKGGVLLAAFDARRPTRDIDLATNALDNDTETVRDMVMEVLSIHVEDGLEFDRSSVRAETTRVDDCYSGLRVTVVACLASATLHFHVDVNVGDPIWPPPRAVQIPRLLGGEALNALGYPLTMVLAEKIVTAVQRGTANTRWRDFVDIAWLTRRHAISGAELVGAIQRVAGHRQVELSPLASALMGYGVIGQAKWSAWRRKQRLQDETPERFDDLLVEVLSFSEPAMEEPSFEREWNPNSRDWE